MAELILMTELKTVPAAISLEDVECPLCSKGKDTIVVTGGDRLNDLPGIFTVLLCSGCGLMRTSPRPTAESIGFYYPDDYGPYKGTVVASDSRKPTALKTRFISLSKRIFDTKAAALPEMPTKGRMLEVGCASGSFLHAMAQKGWRVEGIEFSEEAAQTARNLGYDVATGAIEAVDKPDTSFDLIVGWMVLEHLHDPVGSLRKMARWSKKNGRLAISVPDVGSKSFSFFGPRWHDLHLPNHLFHFDTSSIVRVLDEGGWKVTKI